jgi:hypothetical protein
MYLRKLIFFVDVNGLFMFAKWWKFNTKKSCGYIVNIYFKIWIFLDKVYDDLKDGV